MHVSFACDRTSDGENLLEHIMQKATFQLRDPVGLCVRLLVDVPQIPWR